MKQTREELVKELEDCQNDLVFWQSYQPVNNMGKWSTSVRISSVEKKIVKLRKKLDKLKDKNEDI